MVSTGLTRASADHWEPFANRCHEIPPLDRRDIPTGNIAFKIQTRITDLSKDINANLLLSVSTVSFQYKMFPIKKNLAFQTIVNQCLSWSYSPIQCTHFEKCLSTFDHVQKFSITVSITVEIKRFEEAIKAVNQRTRVSTRGGGWASGSQNLISWNETASQQI